METTSKSIVKYDYTRFPNFLDNFKKTNFWKAMQDTVENSPWHREANVAVHTEMSLVAAEPWMEGKDDRHKLLTSLAILFHDTGKPPMEVVKESAERGVYRSYANHEQRSARIFEGYMVDHWAEMEGWIEPRDVYTVTWIIEHHLPYGLKDPKKVAKLADTLMSLPDVSDADIFFNALLGDAHGRTSDNWEQNTKGVLDWVAAMYEAMDDAVVRAALDEDSLDDRTGAMWLLVGPPGIGKSTIRAELERHCIDTQLRYEVFSLDDMRLRYATTHFEAEMEALGSARAKYRFAFAKCNEVETEFRQYTDKELHRIVKTNEVVIVDNTNTSAKQRRKYLTLADQHKMDKVAIYFPSSLALLHERNNERADKKLPVEAIEALFYSISIPSIGGEVDEIQYIQALFN